MGRVPVVSSSKRQRASLHRALDLPPEGLALRVGTMSNPAILESGPRFGSAGRWCILAAKPRLVFRSWGDLWEIEPLDAVPDLTHGINREAKPLDAFGGLLRWFALSHEPTSEQGGDLPFQGGFIGHYGYDLSPRIERLPRKATPDSAFPDFEFALYDTAICVDRQEGTALLSAYDLVGEGSAALESRLERWLERLRSQPAPPRKSVIHYPPTSNLTRREYIEAVQRVLEYIRAGDIFQANFSQRFSSQGRIDPLDLYLRLRTVSPAPFAAYLRRGDRAIVSASPEWFYQTDGRRILTRPIKGTRPRGSTPEEDALQYVALRDSTKDRAELTMIVDLERNDLGRVCDYGTVKVRGPLTIESYAQVHHLVATIEGRLREDVGPIDIVRAVFPGGSITGAPKIRAMEIIDELEPTRRSVYTGAIGYYSLGGRSAFSIAIRTFLVEGDRVSYQVGGGIVADSVPEQEFEETLHKGRGLHAVLDGAGT